MVLLCVHRHTGHTQIKPTPVPTIVEAAEEHRKTDRQTDRQTDTLTKTQTTHKPVPKILEAAEEAHLEMVFIGSVMSFRRSAFFFSMMLSCSRILSSNSSALERRVAAEYISIRQHRSCSAALASCQATPPHSSAESLQYIYIYIYITQEP